MSADDACGVMLSFSSGRHHSFSISPCATGPIPISRVGVKLLQRCRLPVASDVWGTPRPGQSQASLPTFRQPEAPRSQVRESLTSAPFSALGVASRCPGDVNAVMGRRRRIACRKVGSARVGWSALQAHEGAPKTCLHAGTAQQALTAMSGHPWSCRAPATSAACACGGA